MQLKVVYENPSKQESKYPEASTHQYHHQVDNWDNVQINLAGWPKYYYDMKAKCILIEVRHSKKIKYYVYYMG